MTTNTPKRPRLLVTGLIENWSRLGKNMCGLGIISPPKQTWRLVQSSFPVVYLMNAGRQAQGVPYN
jgi:hypothetical protein